MASNKDFFDQHVPVRLQRALTKSVFENTKEAAKFCFRYFAPPQAKDLSGVYRRAKIEEDWSGVAGLFPKSVRVEVRQYEHQTGFYNELTCGAVKLTQLCIAEPDIVPRLAKFRATLARDGQLALFSTDGDDEEGNEEPGFLYSILTYGIDVNSPKRSWPAFIRVQFPDETFSRYLDEGIDLFARFPDLVSEYIPKPELVRLPTKRRRHGAKQA